MSSPAPSVLFDSRWIGQHGIGRFASELRVRLNTEDLVGRDPLSPGGLLDLERALWRRPRLAFFSPGFNAPLTRRRHFFFTIHDLIHLRVPAESTRTKRLYYQRVVRPAVRMASRVFTVSEFSRREIITWAGVPEHQVVNVHNGVSRALSPHGAKHRQDRPYVLYVGNRKPHKNIPRLLEAFAHRYARDVTLVLTGDADAETEAHLARLRLRGDVQFAGSLCDQALARYYRGALALVMPSLYEGFGLPPLEAMACGTPVVTSHATSLPEVVGDAALTFDPRNTDDLTHALDRVLGDAALRAALRERGLRRAQHFSWDRTANIVQLHLMQAP
ncbi:glycosyltransferase family 4 protein [Deinococcus peraridilitoris]|uniref:Glycosyltransferase n=1 Tax=Deinococcus peraridilitoris (strain DSM 19664 / LMG 22246 / CIP 109416 / KR-200) TaxID=937777 RepID=K9ZZ78_DEIPD|nr:glycosyltransferase family 1 protein [Deinococcus peraridilitoris]AFZ66504.1 glycosyltransferase [Deinococcus peraridilitoris DSM 19664]